MVRFKSPSASKARNKNKFKWFCLRTSINFVKKSGKYQTGNRPNNDVKKYNKVTINISLKIIIEIGQ
jgi:hypothetical protein